MNIIAIILVILIIVVILISVPVGVILFRRSRREETVKDELKETKDKFSEESQNILHSNVDDGEIYMYLPINKYILIDSNKNISYIGSFSFTGDVNTLIGDYNFNFPDQYIQNNQLYDQVPISGPMLKLQVTDYNDELFAIALSVKNETPVLHQGEGFTLRTVNR